jgi:hypothetical protein
LPVSAVKAAFAIANADGLFTKDGAPDWAALKTAAPELFGAPAAKTNAGNGATPPRQVASMNDFIRRGRK